ncbi:MAG: NifB/NifX family molybdenum-iron cluster-binding protein [Dissulfurispiraceae bacterium]|jgi:predicted Fe-Mo cluster-binding NifX family protein
MKVCFPVDDNQGIESAVYNHFGSAPAFIVFNTATKEVSAINNSDLHHTHGACNPMKALSGESVNAIVVSGIGAGALSRLNQLGITVYRAQRQTIRENIVLFEESQLPILTPQQCCGGHVEGCAHN